MGRPGFAFLGIMGAWAFIWAAGCVLCSPSLAADVLGKEGIKEVMMKTK